MAEVVQRWAAIRSGLGKKQLRARLVHDHELTDRDRLLDIVHFFWLAGQVLRGRPPVPKDRPSASSIWVNQPGYDRHRPLSVKVDLGMASIGECRCLVQRVSLSEGNA